MHRDADHLIGQPFADREALVAVPEGHERLLAVHGDRVIDAGAHATGLQPLDERVALPDPDRVLVIDVGHAGPHKRRDNPSQLGVVAGRDRLAAGVVVGELGQLSEPDAGVDIGHAEVVAKDVVVVAHLHPVLTEQRHALGVLGIRGRDHAPLAGGHVLGRIEAEHAGSPGSALARADGGAVRLRGVLHDGQAAALGDVGDGDHIGRLAVQADRLNRAGPGGDGRLELVRIHREVVRSNVHEDGAGAGVQHRGRARDEGEGDCDDLVAGADSVPEEGEV